MSVLPAGRKEAPMDNPKQIDRIILMLEAILIVASLIMDKDTRVGMTCYWAAVSVYHLTDLIIGGKKDDRA